MRITRHLPSDFRRLRASDSKAVTAVGENSDDGATGTKRKADKSQVRSRFMDASRSERPYFAIQMKKPKKLAAPSSKRMRPSDETMANGDELVKPTKTMTLTI